MNIQQKIKNILNVKQNIIALWGAFDFVGQLKEIKSNFSNFKTMRTGVGNILTFITNLIKFPLSMVLLLESYIEIAAIISASMWLTAAMPFAITIFGSILLIASGLYILVLSESSNILHGLMPAFLKNKDKASENKAGQATEIKKLSLTSTCLKLVYLSLRLILVASSFKILIVQLHNISFVSQLLAHSYKIVPALKLVGVYLAVLCSGLAIAELYAKISNSATNTKETNTMLVAIASLISILFAVPLSIYASMAFTSIILPLLIGNIGIMRTCFVAVWHAAPADAFSKGNEQGQGPVNEQGQGSVNEQGQSSLGPPSDDGENVFSITI